MTQTSAEKFANVVLGVAAVGAAYYVLKTPRLRRIAWQMSMAALTGTLPAWITREIRESWEAAGQVPADTSTLEGASLAS
jgi:hypothetical protein